MPQDNLQKGEYMNILFHAHEFNIKEGGPCTKRIDSLATYLANNNYNVTILTSSHNKKNEITTIDRKYKILYAYSTSKIKGSTIKRFLNNIIFGITSFFYGITKLKNIDVVITTSPPPLISIFGYLIAKIKKAKLVYDVRDIWPDVAIEMESFDEKSLYYKVFKFIANFMYKHSDYITTVTPGKVKKIKKYADSNNKVLYIPNGFDDNLINFAMEKFIIEKYELDKKFTIVYIGNVGLAQNLDALIELAKTSKKQENMQFLIFGEGAYKNELQSKINELRLKNISLEGKIDYCKVYTILKYSKISFISLKNNKMTDSIPTKMFDALGIGCPILLLAKGDSCSVLDEVHLGEHAENIEELKTKFKYMIENYEKYTKYKENSMNYIMKRYSRREIAKKFEKEVLKKMN